MPRGGAIHDMLVGALGGGLPAYLTALVTVRLFAEDQFRRLTAGRFFNQGRAETFEMLLTLFGFWVGQAALRREASGRREGEPGRPALVWALRISALAAVALVVLVGSHAVTLGRLAS